MTDFIEQAEKALDGITPGPWHWSRQSMDTECPIWTLAPGVLIADGTDGTPDGDKIDQANARFIAAAPTLLRQAITEVRERDALIYEFKLAIAGGEDAPGAAHAMTLGEAQEYLTEKRRQWYEDQDTIDRLKAENADLKLRIEAENEADNEMHAIHKARIEALEGQVQVADMLANKLKAENAKLREDTQRGNEPHKENTND